MLQFPSLIIKFIIMALGETARDHDGSNPHPHFPTPDSAPFPPFLAVSQEQAEAGAGATEEPKEAAATDTTAPVSPQPGL